MLGVGKKGLETKAENNLGSTLVISIICISVFLVSERISRKNIQPW